MHSSAIGCHYALAAAGRSAPPHTSLGARRHASASLPMSTKIGSSSSSNNSRRRLLVSRAAINIPPDALVNPKRIKNEQWGIERKGDKGEEVTLWFVIPGVEELSEVQDKVEVNLPDGSNVLTIKRKKKNTNEDELLDVRLLLTAEYKTKGIKVVAKKEDEVRLEVTVIQNTSSILKIDIK